MALAPGRSSGFLLLAKLRAQVVAVSRRLHQSGWVANHDGNASVRLEGDRFLITCTGMSKIDVDDASLLVVDADGNVLEGRKRPFSELELHLAAYAARPEVNAVLHAHSPFATAFGLAGLELTPMAMPEVVLSLGPKIPTVPRHLPRTLSGVHAVAEHAVEYDAMLLAGNGVLTLGDDLHQALLRMELVEHYAKILHATSALGGVTPLAPEELSFLVSARETAGLGPKKAAAARRGAEKLERDLEGLDRQRLRRESNDV
ncbi:MAG: class II aldolase/adducin family protein [Myxococcaceae bacterium]